MNVLKKKTMTGWLQELESDPRSQKLVKHVHSSSQNNRSSNTERRHIPHFLPAPWAASNRTDRWRTSTRWRCRTCAGTHHRSRTWEEDETAWDILPESHTTLRWKWHQDSLQVCKSAPKVGDKLSRYTSAVLIDTNLSHETSHPQRTADCDWKTIRNRGRTSNARNIAVCWNSSSAIHSRQLKVAISRHCKLPSMVRSNIRFGPGSKAVLRKHTLEWSAGSHDYPAEWWCDPCILLSAPPEELPSLQNNTHGLHHETREFQTWTKS